MKYNGIIRYTVSGEPCFLTFQGNECEFKKRFCQMFPTDELIIGHKASMMYWEKGITMDELITIFKETA